MRIAFRAALPALCVAAACSHASQPPRPERPSAAQAAPSHQASIERSNQNAQVLLEVQARFVPEAAARFGVSGIDDRIADLTPGHDARFREALDKAASELGERRKAERDPLVAQDLDLLVDW